MMKAYLFLLFIMLGCGFLSGQNRGKVKFDSRLRLFEIDSTDWIYPWYVVKHDNKWENTFGERITAKDTAHLIQNSTCYQDLPGCYLHRLSFCKARFGKDSLIIQIYDESASNDEWLTFRVHGKKFTCEYAQYYNAEPNALVRDPQLVLSRKRLRKGDYLEGKVEAYFEVKRTIGGGGIQKGRIRGNFKVKIE